MVSCAEAGDQIANDILRDAVEELALTVKAVVQRLGLAGEGVVLFDQVKLYFRSVNPCQRTCFIGFGIGG